MHGASEITGIATVAVAAMLCGMAMVRMRQPAIIGYIFAGLLLGPNGLSLVDDRQTIDLLAQLGVIMLLYFVGMELSLRSFRTIWKITIISAMAQIGLSVGALYILGSFFDWPKEWAILFGFCLALSSTAVAVKVLEETGELRSTVGRLAIGILIAQDLAVAPMLVVIGNMASDSDDGLIHMIIEVSLSIGILIAIILFLTRRQKVDLPFSRIVSPNSDLKPLAALAFCFGFASIAGVIGLSPAFGAFLAGLIVGNSAQRQEVHENAGPIQAILMMVFFLSIGLLIDLPFVWQNIWLLVGLLVFVIIFKTALNVIILRIQGQNWQTSFSVALVIGQLGEFSFVMAAVAASTSVIGGDIHKLIVALTVFSLIASPIMFDLNRRIRHNAARHISSLGGLLQFAYFREWQITVSLSRAAFMLAFRVATWAQIRMDKMRRHASRKLKDSHDRDQIGDVGDPSGPVPEDASMSESDDDPAEKPTQSANNAPAVRKSVRNSPKKAAAKKTASKQAESKKAESKKAASKKVTAKKAAVKTSEPKSPGDDA